MTPVPQSPPEDDGKDWRHVSLQQLRDEVTGQHHRMGGYVQGLVDSNATVVKVIVETLSAKFVTQRDLEHTEQAIDLKYGWIPGLLKWVGIGLGGGLLGAWLKTILK